MSEVDQAWALVGQDDFCGAAALSVRLLREAPDDASLLCCYATSRWQLGIEPRKCVADLRRAAALAPADGFIWHNLARVLASEGAIEEACVSFAKALELKSDDAEAFYGFSQNHRFAEETAVVRDMLGFYGSGRLTARAREFACFGLAKAYSDLGQAERAMHFCLEGNRLAQRAYDAVLPRAHLTELRSMVARDGFRKLSPGAFASDATPVFIVGMPRSGTTLVETVLSRHSRVYAGGEMTLMLEVERALLERCRQDEGYEGGPHEMLARVPSELFTQNAEMVSRRFETLAREEGQAFTVFTDKLPENTQRLGLISLLFPRARIIYVRRHPVDCCVSNLFQRFARGNGFAFRQDLLGERYRQVAETMTLWRQSLDLPILDVSYEALTADPETAIQRMLAFAGLEWEPACLAPHFAERRIMTASQYQVRQPINRRSVGQWRRYEAWVQPLIEALGGPAAIERDEEQLAALAAC